MFESFSAGYITIVSGNDDPDDNSFNKTEKNKDKPKQLITIFIKILSKQITNNDNNLKTPPE